MIKPPTADYVSDGRAYWSYMGTDYLIATDGLIRGCAGAYSSVNHPGFLSLTRADRKYVAAWAPFVYEREVYHADGGTNLGHLHIASGSIDAYSRYCARQVPGYAWSNPMEQFTKKLDTDTKALSRLQERVKGANVNLAVAYAERKQLISMLTNSITRVRRGYEAVVRGAFRRARDILQPVSRSGRVKYYDRLSNRRVDRFKNTSNNAANYWLEFQYGWRPLLSDIYDSCELLADTYHRARPTRFSASHTDRISETVPHITNFYDGCFREDLRYTKIQTTRYVLEVCEEDSVLSALSHTGVTNPLLVAWELVPYSFVADWFLPVGNYLEQLGYATGLQFKRGTVSTRIETNGTTILVPMRNSTGLSRGVNLGTGSPIKWKTFYSKRRALLTSFPYAKLPFPEFKYGTERALSAISLLTQLARRNGYR